MSKNNKNIKEVNEYDDEYCHCKCHGDGMINPHMSCIVEDKKEGLKLVCINCGKGFRYGK